MKKSFGFILIFLILIFVGYGIYSFYNGREFVLYEEAKALQASGNVSGAYDKMLEAVKLNMSNRKIVAYKAELFFILENDKLLKEAVKLRQDALLAMDYGNYVSAAEKFDKALEAISKISLSSNEYTLAEALQKKIVTDVNRLVKEAPEKYYNKAREFYQSGQYERAYFTLDYIINPDSKITSFKDELAYLIGNRGYDDAQKKTNPDVYLMRDSIQWFSRVSDKSPNKVSSVEKSGKLKQNLNKVSKNK